MGEFNDFFPDHLLLENEVLKYKSGLIRRRNHPNSLAAVEIKDIGHSKNVYRYSSSESDGENDYQALTKVDTRIPDGNNLMFLSEFMKQRNNFFNMEKINKEEEETVYE